MQSVNVPTCNEWLLNSYLKGQKVSICMDSKQTFEAVMVQMDKLEMRGHTSLTLSNNGNIFLQ